MTATTARPAVADAARTAAVVGWAAAGHLWRHLRGRLGGAVAASLKLWLLLLLAGVGLVVAVVVLPVIAIVFAMAAGVSHGMALDVPAPAEAAGPPLAAGQLACPVPGSVLTQPFGPSELPGEPAMFGYPHFHTGLDLA